MCSERGWQGEGDAGQRRNFLQVEKGGGGLLAAVGGGERGERAWAGPGQERGSVPWRSPPQSWQRSAQGPGSVQVGWRETGTGTGTPPFTLVAVEGSPVKSAPGSAGLCASERLSVCPSIRPSIYLATRLFLAPTAAFW